jgi:cysteine desulfurase
VPPEEAAHELRSATDQDRSREADRGPEEQARQERKDDFHVDRRWDIDSRPAANEPGCSRRAEHPAYNRHPMAIYLDHAATTPLRPEVLDAMLPYLTTEFGNPSSAHTLGRKARAALDEAHERIARRLNAEAREIVLTSGGTEANNLALKGAAWAGKAQGHRIVTSSIEHHAVGHTLRYLEKFGFEVVELPVDRYGRVDPADVERAMTDKTILVSIMLANNEVGTLQPIAEIGRRVRTRKGVLFHVDGVQAAPYVELDVERLGVDFLSIAAHKFEGPKGIGALYIRHGTHIVSQQQGGEQERHRRAGTENVAGAVGLAAAFDLVSEERVETNRRLRKLRDRLKSAVLAVDGTELTGHPNERLPGLLSIIGRDTDGTAVALSLDLEGICCSVGSACTTGSTEVSHVLTAMGYPEDEARGSLRLSLGRTTTEDEIETACEVVPRVLGSMRVGQAAVTADPLGQGVGV